MKLLAGVLVGVVLCAGATSTLAGWGRLGATQPCACAPLPVGVHLDPPLLEVPAGEARAFTVSVTDNDSPGCPALRVELSPGSGGGAECPSGLVDDYLGAQDQFVTLEPGQTLTFQSWVSVGAGAPPGRCYEDFFVYALREADTITEYLQGDSAVISIP